MLFRTMWMLTTGALILVAPAMAIGNFVTNGDFTTSAAGWTLSGAGCAGSPLFDAGGNPGGSVLLNGCGESNADPSAAQTVSGFLVGQQYSIQADLRLHAAASGFGTGKSFGVFLDNEPASPRLLVEFGDDIWHTIFTTFTASATSHTIIFSAELDTRTPGQTVNTDVSYYLDNVIVAPVSTGGVPEPAALWLVGTGLAILGYRRRSRI